MFKRSTKITALLVAAASIISTVPAMASTKLANKEGTVENAVAFKDGKYLYEGYRTDDDEKGLYYNSGDKDKMLDDADELGVKFDDKYVSAKDGSDNYVVDLSTGKITDDDTLEDLESTAQTKLENKLKKTDRYGSNVAPVLTRQTGGSLEDVWYSYSATTSGGGTAFGYTNASGTYIDCSFDLNAYVYYNATGNANDGKMYKLEDIEDTADVDTGVKSKVTNVAFDKFLGQDEKYIYSLIKVDIDNAMDIKTLDVDGAYNVLNNGTRYFVQKVAKDQGDKKDDAYKPKSTECFEVTANADNGDLKDAFNELKLTNVTTKIVDGAIYITKTDDDKVKTTKVVLKTSEKLKVKGSNAATDKVSGHVAKKDGDKDTKADWWTIDTNGTVWAIYNGEIKKSAKIADFTTEYTCDRSLDRLDVYDESNLIAWDANGDVYTTVTEGSKAAQDEAEEIVGDNTAKDPVKTGWVQAADGTWTLIDVTGAKVTGWANVGGVWYYMDKSTTVMKTGWVNDGGTWYYCNASGAMQTGWLNDAGTWYYLQSNGAMKTGWLNDNGTWYYLNANGSMAANTTVDGYVLGANGAWIR